MAWVVALVALPVMGDLPATSQPATQVSPVVNVWFWPIVLFVLSFVLGVAAVLGGVGGAVLYVPIVSAFLPFHTDYVKCAGLLVALSGSVAASPQLLGKGFASLRLALPMAMVAAASSIVGASIGCGMSQDATRISMGACILLIAGVMMVARKSEYPVVRRADGLSALLGIHGVYHEPTAGRDISWTVHRTPLGLVAFVGIGIMAGMFGVGAGWANVPVLNLVLGTPLKLAVGTSKFLIGVTDTSAAWVYLHEGSGLPMIIVPSIVGMMLGSLLGARLLGVARPRAVRIFVLTLLVFAGGRTLLQGLHLWN